MLLPHPLELGHCGISVFSLTNKEKQLKQVDSLAYKCCSLDPDSALIVETFRLCLPTCWIPIANWVEIDIKWERWLIALLYAFALKPIFIYVWVRISSKAWLGSWLGISLRSMLITQFGCWSNVWLPHDSNQICDRRVQLYHLLRVGVRALWYPHILMASFVDAVICVMLKTDISNKGRRKISAIFQVRKWNCRERFRGKFIKPRFWASSKDFPATETCLALTAHIT